MWQILYNPKSLKFIKKLDKKSQENIENYIKRISQMHKPESLGKPLTANLKGFWRYRVGDYRIICEIRKKELVILVIDAGHRSVIYKNSR